MEAERVTQPGHDHLAEQLRFLLESACGSGNLFISRETLPVLVVIATKLRDPGRRKLKPSAQILRAFPLSHLGDQFAVTLGSRFQPTGPVETKSNLIGHGGDGVVGEGFGVRILAEGAHVGQLVDAESMTLLSPLAEDVLRSKLTADPASAANCFGCVGGEDRRKATSVFPFLGEPEEPIPAQSDDF